MQLIINLLIIALIIVLAGYQIYRAVLNSKKGKCAACEYDCAVKRLHNHAH